jgi:3-oxoadipate enol-lactonase
MTLQKKLSIHYELSGPDEAPVLVLSHALGTNLTLWDQQVEALRGAFRVLRYDTRGHGRSPASQGPYTISLLALDVLSLLDELGVGKAHFCGISMGGLVGQYLAVHHPDRVASLILSNTASTIGTHEKWERRIREVTKAGMAAVLDEVVEGWFSARFRSMRPPIIASLANALKATSPEGYIGCCQALRDADLSDLIEQVNAPALIIAGTEDQATPVAGSRFLHQKIRNSQLVTLECAHLACAEAPAEFTNQLNKFLTTKANL